MMKVNELNEDKEFIKEAKDFVEFYTQERHHFFGYPGNLTEDSETVKQLRELETKLYYVNNAGDPFEQGDNSYDGKKFERRLLNLFFKRYKMDPQTSWGYITSGGSESNWWGIKTGFINYPNGHLLFSNAAHYSVLKAITIGNKALLNYSMIKTVSSRNEAIDISLLMNKVDEIVQKGQVPILLLTWGTTKLGSLDDVRTITTLLKEKGIPYYCHVDAAYYGGLPENQVDAPVIHSLDTLNADSISISFHKYLGVPAINSIVLSKHKGSGSYISYIGHHDTTILGSRTFPILSATQRIKEVFERSETDEYCKNVRWMEKQLLDNKIPYHKDGLSNIFVISKPSDFFLKKYHLASFEGKDGKINCSHIIMNPFHTENEITELINDLKNENLREPNL